MVEGDFYCHGRFLRDETLMKSFLGELHCIPKKSVTFFYEV